ncbi:SHC-transforming 3 [Pelobates cultripes]|uniref:SHC-transforming 3 n=1 Tax=Pelobates cultripes TaxID=61616 RepID=A0AAD1S9Z6_PELCU|nr:SHC-transforming 3 [Pelobates cultripes]
MLQRTKYNRFKNESVTPVDDLFHNLSMNSKVSTVATTTATSPCTAATEVLQKEQEDGSTTLCTFIHKVSHLKLSSSGNLLGIKNLSSAVRELASSKLQGSSSALNSAAGVSDNTCNLVSTPPWSQQDVSKMSTGKKTRSEEMNLVGEDWNQSSSFVNKPSRGWLHSNEKILGPGVTKPGHKVTERKRAELIPERHSSLSMFCLSPACAPIFELQEMLERCPYDKQKATDKIKPYIGELPFYNHKVYLPAET